MKFISFYWISLKCSSQITSLKDCLCLEHCGKFLHNLAKDCSDRLPCRQWPINYTEGKPNLVICRNLTDVLTLILSLYLYSPQQPFPSVSEVLICSEETSFEEVELLLKRAILKQENVGQCSLLVQYFRIFIYFQRRSAISLRHTSFILLPTIGV